MKEKKPIKISLSTFFLIIAIIVITVMGYFLYIANTKTNDMISKEKELNAKIAKLENEIITSTQTQINATKINADNENASSNEAIKNLSYSTLSGIYIGDAKVEPGTTPDGNSEVYLYLYEDGGFIYNNNPGGFESGLSGYYTFDGNELGLHEVLAMR